MPYNTEQYNTKLRLARSNLQFRLGMVHSVKGQTQGVQVKL